MSHISFWEEDVFLKNIDYTIIGSGIVGLTCALKIKELHPKSNIKILERGFLPTGASTKNAGFTCFGSPSELLDDLKNQTEKEVFNLVKLRLNGLKKLKKLVGEPQMNYKEYGGYELFNCKNDYYNSLEQLPYLNKLLHPLFNQKVFSTLQNPNIFGLKNNSLIIKNKFEGQINTGLMMKSLLTQCRRKGIDILNGFNVEKFQAHKNGWTVFGNNKYISTQKLLICNNAFASKLLPEFDLKPARAQVLITKPIENLKIKGCFHMEEGYYYFRNVENRVLLGGGRNLDFKGEETFNFETTNLIQNKLDKLLKEVILPNQNFEIDKRWSGIMGVGKSKNPIVKKIDTNLFCGIRMGGMGVALGSEIGHQLANLTQKKH
jgi:glycine/D-amino acid oxidase-like deaminating enzyme